MKSNGSSGKHILIVDDDERVRFIVHKALDKAARGYQITTAKNGAEALRKIQQGTFDLLLSDLRLPRMDGITVTQVFIEHFPEAAVLWMTAYGCHHVRQQAQHLGVHACLGKPVEIGVIRTAVAKALASIQ